VGLDDIKRISAPETRDGRQWQVQLNAIPSRDWLALFKLPGASSLPAPHRVAFDRDTAGFKSDEAHVEQWIRWIDEAITATNARHAARLDQASRARATREDAETSERERIRLLNDRFKNL
jgi:hypothetical protein